MRLLDTETGQFVEKDPADGETVYSILSHTWDIEKGEQTYKELKKIQRRYGRGSRASQSRPSSLGDSTSYSPEHDRGGPSPTPPASALLSDSPSVTTHPLAALGRLTPSEVEALLRVVAETYGLASPTGSAPAPSDPSAPCQEHQSKPLPQSIWDDPDLSPKIRDACAVARKNGYRYIWIDSCCIDKSSSSELSESINSMYKWYSLAAVCYAYLADVPPGEDHHAEGSAFRESRWFGRGWTLQELIAPGLVEFLSQDWAHIGSKHTLDSLVESVTKIDYKALLHMERLEAFSVAQRLSWAADRKTTREEDRAYSLLGIFDINMPTLYGEGDRAFRRLQEQIMQRIPGWQSLFALGDVYLSSRLSEPPRQNACIIDTPQTLRAVLCISRGLQFAESPDSFRNCQAISNPRRDTILPFSHRNKIEYTSTPYGIRTQFQMIPLTRDFLLREILHSEDAELDLLCRSPEGSQWYLAILTGCEHAERPGHLLGRVCYILPSDTNVEFVHTGYIHVMVPPPYNHLCLHGLFTLSPETIEHHHPQTELKTVYIPLPDRAILPSILYLQPYTAIKLVLLRETRDALRTRGYTAELRDPDPTAHPTTHWLALSKDEHTITVEFRHTLEDRGKWFTIDAEVKLSRSRVQLHESASAPEGSDQADCRTVSWTDPGRPWNSKLDHMRVGLSAAGAGPLTVDIGLDFTGAGYYVLRVDVLSDVLSEPAAAEPAVDQAAEVERIKDHPPERIEDHPPPWSAIHTEDADGREEDAGGQAEIASVETRVGDVAAAGNKSGREDGDGVSEA